MNEPAKGQVSVRQYEFVLQKRLIMDPLSCLITFSLSISSPLARRA